MSKEINTDLNLNGVAAILVIDTDSYAGNFERELSAFVCGAYDEERYHGGSQNEEFNDFLEKNPGHVLTNIREKLGTAHHNEYDAVGNSIWPTPGAGGDYNSVAIFLDEAMTEEEILAIKDRAVEMGKNHVTHMGRPSPFKILNVRQLKVKTRAVTVMESYVTN